MNLQPSTQNRLYQHSINIEVSNQQETAGSACDRLLSNFATVASAAGGILGIAAAALQIKNPDSAGGSVTENTAIAAVVGNIMALVGTGISRDSERDIGASPLLANSLGALIGAPATVTNALSLVDLTNNPDMSVSKAHYSLTTAALALTGLATLINIGRIMMCRHN